METSSTHQEATEPAAAPVAPADNQPPIQIPAIESPFNAQMLNRISLPPAVEMAVRSLIRDGYAIIDPGITDIADKARRIDADLEGKYDKDRRVLEGWYTNQDVRDIAMMPNVLNFMRLIYQRDPIPFQTLNFEVGTEQPAHSDTIHFDSLPRRFMCGVWVALEDVHPDSGPLIVHPGSHLLPSYEMQDLGVPSDPGMYHHYETFVRNMLEARGFPGAPVLLKQGQAVLWLANLYHGGSPIRDPERTRKSQITHYYFSDCQYFFPMQSNLSEGRIKRREVIDLRDGRFVTHRSLGRDVDLGDLSDVCTYPRPLPDFVQGSEP